MIKKYFTKRALYTYFVGFPAVMLTWLFYNKNMALDLADEIISILNYMDNK